MVGIPDGTEITGRGEDLEGKVGRGGVPHELTERRVVWDEIVPPPPPESSGNEKRETVNGLRL